MSAAIADTLARALDQQIHELRREVALAQQQLAIACRLLEGIARVPVWHVPGNGDVTGSDTVEAAHVRRLGALRTIERMRLAESCHGHECQIRGICTSPTACRIASVALPPRKEI